MPRVELVLAQALRRTPLLHPDVAHRGRVRRPGLEQHGPTGSVKDRRSVGLLQALHDAPPLTPGMVVESTSGDLGPAPARLLRLRGRRTPAFPKEPHRYDRAVRGADVEAIAVCRIPTEDVGLVLERSNGRVVRALLTDHRNGRADDRLAVRPVADGSGEHRDTLSSDDRTAEQGVVKETSAAVEQLRREGLFLDRKHQEH
ncbi:hypothetical protein ACFU8Q_09585 [Streptomyces sp. NPDC057543]|uniref:hypothetical protein n=1 Tax=Streptomyces sp. NPDC057543 TaxID=3346163 RepID=UPI003698F2E5